MSDILSWLNSTVFPLINELHFSAFMVMGYAIVFTCIKIFRQVKAEVVFSEEFSKNISASNVSLKELQQLLKEIEDLGANNVQEKHARKIDRAINLTMVRVKDVSRSDAGILLKGINQTSSKGRILYEAKLLTKAIARLPNYMRNII